MRKLSTDSKELDMTEMFVLIFLGLILGVNGESLAETRKSDSLLPQHLECGEYRISGRGQASEEGGFSVVVYPDTTSEYTLDVDDVPAQARDSLDDVVFSARYRQIGKDQDGFPTLLWLGSEKVEIPAHPIKGNVERLKTEKCSLAARE